MASLLQNMLDPNYGDPIGDFTGRQDPGPGYVPDEYDELQQGLEDLGVFPIAPGAGDMLSELGDLILYQNSRRGGKNLPTNDFDRFAALPATWAANASKEFGSLLTMMPEQLVQLKRSVDGLINNPDDRSAFWEGLKSAGREYSADPMKAAEDFGSGVVPSSGFMVPLGIAAKVKQGLGVNKLEADAISGLSDEGIKNLAKSDPSSVVSDAPRQDLIVHHVDDWDDSSVTEFMESDVIDPTFQPKLKPGVESPPSSAVTELAGMSDEGLDEQIKGINQLLNAPGTMEPVTENNLKAMVKAYAKERDDRRAGKGSVDTGGSAGASKTQQPLEHMTNYGGKPLAEPGAGWIGSDAFNIQNFTEAADFGDLDTLIDNARPGKSGMWAFTEDPDPAIFSINGFLNRLSNPGHEANNVELVHLVKILTKAKKRKSIGDKNSMAEDLWTNIAGPTKELLRGFGFEL
tara:strand:- start:25 stop:1404 length:1380 start_codon:yes stop_codon:yes gene_type:complete